MDVDVYTFWYKWVFTCCYNRYDNINGYIKPSKYFIQLPLSISLLTSECGELVDPDSIRVTDFSQIWTCNSWIGNGQCFHAMYV